MSQNPFSFESPVQDRERFFNRERITRDIIDRLRLMQDSSVIGEQRMGKTSLLYHLSDPAVLRRYGLDPARYVFVYVSFQDAAHLTPSLFWQRVLSVIVKSVVDADLHTTIERMLGEGEIDPSDVERLFLRVARKGLRVALLLDEFETVTRAVKLDADFFAHLRSLAILPVLGLIFVTSSRRKLNELSHAGIVGSPFFNIFDTFVLRAFEQPDAEAMLDTALGGTDVKFSRREVDYLSLLSGRHPCLLQMAASHLFDAYAVQGLADTDSSSARLEHVEREFNLQAERYLRHYWQQSTNHERLFLLALSALRRSGAPDAPIDLSQLQQVYRDAEMSARVLADRGLVKQDERGYRSLSPALERWVVHEVTRAGSHGDYVAWLEDNAASLGRPVDSLRESAATLAGVLNSTYWPLVTEWARKTDEPQRMVGLIHACAQPTAERPIWRDYARALV